MQVDYFLKIEGVEGGSRPDGAGSALLRKGEIQIESFSWGEAQTGAKTTDSDRKRVQMQDFYFKMRTNKSSPELFLACATGELFKKAVLSVRRADGRDLDFELLKLTFTDSYVPTFELAAEERGIPLEQVSLSCRKMEWEYTRGPGHDAVRAGFDLRTHRAV